MENTSFRNFLDDGFSSRKSMCDVLKSLIINNIEYFESDHSKSGRFFSECFSRFLVNLNEVEQQASEISRFAHEYDYDRSAPGNGYRSMMSVFDSCIQHCIHLCRAVCVKRNSFVFRRDYYAKEVESYCDLMGCLSVILCHTQKLRHLSEPHHLFPSNLLSPVDLLLEAENIDTTCFYGRCLGFQFYDSLKKPLRFISLMMASFSDAYYNTGGMITRTASSVVSCGKYICSPELRATRIVEVARKASVDFCKSFWLLQEHQLLQQVPGFVCVSLQVNRVMQVPIQLMSIKTTNGNFVDIPAPKSHLPTSPVICRLLSASMRDGQLTEEEVTKYSDRIKSPSPYLIIQCHGGGFVAQSSKSHEVYLRDWAVKLDVPIFCIDYSLAPDAPYPRPLEECFYAYAWAIQNAHSLGSTGEKICFVGDSAGGNLLAGVIMKSIELGIRVPDGFMSIYTPYIMNFLPSPSRLLCLMDPLLPFGFMMRCLGAYAGHPCNEASSTNENDLCCVDNSDCLSSVPSSCGSSIYLVTESPNLSAGGNTNASSDCETTDVNNSEKDGENNRQQHSATLKINSDQVAPRSISLNVVGDESDRSSFEEVSSEIDTSDMKSGTSTLNNEESQSEMDTKSESNLCNENKEAENSEDYLDWYLLDAEDCTGNAVIRSESTESDENVLFEMPVDFPFKLTQRMSKLTGKVMSGISGMFSNDKESERRRRQLNKRKKSYNGIFADRCLNDSGSLVTLMEEFKKFTVNTGDPYLSPYYASDDILKHFPPTNFLSTALDPCLDDSVMFGKRLRALGCQVRFDILDHLPHGFLNLILVSKDALEGSDLSVARIRDLLNIPESDT